MTSLCLVVPPGAGQAARVEAGALVLGQRSGVSSRLPHRTLGPCGVSPGNVPGRRSRVCPQPLAVGTHPDAGSGVSSSPEGSDERDEEDCDADLEDVTDPVDAAGVDIRLVPTRAPWTPGYACPKRVVVRGASNSDQVVCAAGSGRCCRASGTATEGPAPPRLFSRSRPRVKTAAQDIVCLLTATEATQLPGM